LAQRPAGVNIEMVGAGLAISGHTILHGVNLTIKAGSHVAIVGPSGAGKSSLVGLLLGWSQTSAGSILIDGRPLDTELVRQLRAETAWVEPGVQLWNRSLENNLRYGSKNFNIASFGKIIEMSELRELLESLPDGLQTPLGESGALVSGGEGQRVRLARAMLKGGVRLVVLDEPFAALDRDRRDKLITKMRRLWHGATLLYVTHNIGEALGFDRVLVVENGQIVEDGIPDDLLIRDDSHYRAMYESDVAVRESFMSSEFWRRLELRRGRLIEKNEKKLLSDKSQPRLVRDNEWWLVDDTGTNS
jgi:ATP-binding cassette subfamily B protein